MLCRTQQAGYMTCSALMLITNKVAVHLLPAPSFVLFSQLFVTAAAVKIAGLIGQWDAVVVCHGQYCSQVVCHGQYCSQCHALVYYYGPHRRPVARQFIDSNYSTRRYWHALVLARAN